MSFDHPSDDTVITTRKAMTTVVALGSADS
jgi:hypothetical protein